MSLLAVSAPHAATLDNALGISARKEDTAPGKVKVHTNENSSGLEFRATLRDIWILCHRLRSADDIGIQLVRRGTFVHTLNDLARELDAIPIHAFARRISTKSKWARYVRSRTPKQRWNMLVNKELKVGNVGKLPSLVPEDDPEQLLPNNVRVILKGSRLGDHDAVRAKATMTFEDRLFPTLLEIQDAEKEKEQGDAKPRVPEASDVEEKTDPSSETVPPTSSMPPRVKPSITIYIERNHLSATISAAGHSEHSLHRRGLRPYTMETSLRESVAAPIVALCQEHSTPLSELPPELAKLNAGVAQTSRLAYGKVLHTLTKAAPDVLNPLIADTKKPRESAHEQNQISTESPENSAVEGSSKEAAVSRSSDSKTGDGIPSSLTKIADKATPLVHARDQASSLDITASVVLDSLRQADPSIRVFDPFCGAGTILIESAMKLIGLPARALPRPFAFENWPIHDAKAYQHLIDKWSVQHDQIFNTYLGYVKHHAGENHDLFPRFFGSDLRIKSLAAATHNIKVAGLTPFISLAQGDFELVMKEAYKVATESLRAQALRFNGSPQDIPFSELVKKSSAISANSKKVSPYVERKIFNSVAIPNLAGYTMITNIPWGVSDEKPLRPAGDKDEDAVDYDDPNFERYRVNTTQQEPMEDLYFRFGRALYLYGGMFRDVFVLSANSLFEKTTAAGAAAAKREEAKEKQAATIRQQLLLQQQQSSSDHLRLTGTHTESTTTSSWQGVRSASSEVAPSPAESKPNSLAQFAQTALAPLSKPLSWTKITTFYNQGVKTHLLKLDK